MAPTPPGSTQPSDAMRKGLVKSGCMSGPFGGPCCSAFTKASRAVSHSRVHNTFLLVLPASIASRIGVVSWAYPLMYWR